MPRRYDSADAKRRILTACVRFFLEKGYTRTTVAEIVKEADVSISTFQNVFRTKDGVLVELAKSCRRSMCMRWRPASSWL